MVRRIVAFPAVLLLLGCVVSPETEGSVYEITDRTVTIRGAFSMDGTIARPTQAMIAQAKEICPTAKYVSANPSPSDNYTFLYLFQCR
jgi:hypothetical protein